MPLTFSNKLPTPISPFALGAALRSKTNPSPLSPLAQSTKATNFTPVPKTAAPATKIPAVTNQLSPVTKATQTAPAVTGIPSEAQARANIANYYQQNQQPVQQQPQRVTGNTTQSPNLVGQTFSQPPAPVGTTGGIPNNVGLQGQLLGKGIENLTEAGQIQKEAGLLRQGMLRQTRDVNTNPYYSRDVRVGLSSNIAQQQGAQLEGLAAQEKAATSIGQAYLGGASQAAPVQVGYGTQYVSPITGQSALPQGGNLAPSQQSSQYAQDVISGRRSYDDAVSAMGLYGNAGKQFLDQAISSINPSFNFAQAQTLGAQQGALVPNYNFALQALNNVESALGNLGGAQKTNFPLLNAGVNLGSLYSGVGSEQTRAFIGAVQTLRNAYASLLASAKGGTPTDYSAQAQAEIPDQPTPNDIAAIKHNFEVLGQARTNIFSNPGGQTQAQVGGGQGGSSSLFSF